MDAEGPRLVHGADPPGANPDYCKKGSDHPSAKVMPLDASPRQASVYDPKTQKWMHASTLCFATHHLYFAKDEQHAVVQPAAGRQSGVVGWLKTKQFIATGDAAKSQGWTPIVVDTNGNGKRDELRRAERAGRSRRRTSASSRPSTASCRARSTTRSGASRWASASRA